MLPEAWKQTISQVRTLCWLRWRLTHNQMARAGKINLLLGAIFLWGMIALAAISFLLALGLGLWLFPLANDIALLVAWDVIICAYLLMFLSSLMMDVQSSQLLSMEKMLQFPISPRQAFRLNFLASIISVGTLWFAPTVAGACLALMATRGLRFLLLWAVTFAFLFLVAALAFQLRSWLASIMTNERKRRRVFVFFMMIFVVGAQLPNILIQLGSRSGDSRKEVYNSAIATLQERLEKQEITQAQFSEQREVLRAERSARHTEEWRSLLVFWNQLLPIGWVAIAANEIDQSRFLIPLGVLALFGLGAAFSLRLAYVSSLNALTNVQTSESHSASKANRSTNTTSSTGNATWFDYQLPLLSQRQSALIIGNLLNILRAPETKMAMLGPLLMVFAFGMIFFTNRSSLAVPPSLVPAVLIAVLGMCVFAIVFACLNIFGSDGTGFKTFVLQPAPRNHLLLAKNIGTAVLGFVPTVPIVAATAVYFGATLVQLLATFILLPAVLIGASLLGNLVSVRFPIGMRPGTSHSPNINFKTIVVQMGASMLIYVTFVPSLVAIILDYLIATYFPFPWFSCFLTTSILQLAASIFLYRYFLPLQAKLLVAQEPNIVATLQIPGE